MKHIKKVLSAVLVLCMILSLAPISVFAADTEAESGSDDTFYKIVHLDCGRKYFTKGWIESLIDEMAADGYTHLELAFGNDGLRFLLDDMSVTANGTTYSSVDVTAGIQAGNKAYYDFGTNELTEAEMDEIIEYAAASGIEIMPLLNTPGHMDAIITCMTNLGISGAYNNSARTVDVTNSTAVAFTQALVNKYITYFAGKSSTVFNLGADEYANDIYTSGSMGFGQLQSRGQYDEFVTYVNDLATLVENAGMTPMAFNDGIYFNNVTNQGTFDSNIMIAYWSSGWTGYTVASAQTLANMGHKMINTHGDFYYVLGKTDNFDSGSSYASNWDNKSFQGTTFTEDQAGAMFCIWCDYPNAETEDQITAKVIDAGVLSAMSEAIGHMPETEPGGNIVFDDDTGVEVNFGASNVESITVTPADDIPELDGETYVAYDITPDNNYTQGMEAVVHIPLPDELANASDDELTGFGVDDYGKIVPIDGTKDGADYFFTVSHFSTYGVMLLDGDPDSTETDPAPTDPVEVTENKTITVTAGQTATATIEGADYSNNIVETELDKSIATVSASYAETAGGSGTPEKATSVTSGETYLISDGNGHYLTLSNGSLTNSTDPNTATKWTVTSSGSDYYTISSNGYYVSCVTNNQWALGVTTSSTNYITWTLGDNGFYYNYSDSYLGYITYSNNSWSFSWNSTTNAAAPYTVTPAEPTKTTTVTFTGVAVGTTYVTVGNTRYTINVVAEDLSKVNPLTVEYWITNRTVTANGAISMPIAATDYGIYSENGVLFSSLVPASGVATDDTTATMAFWKGTCLDSSHKQTTDNGVDQTKSGTDFTYIRYWDGSWAYSADSETWMNVDDGEQIVAYYLQETDVTDEVTTQVVDWGPQYSNWNSQLSYLGTKYVLVDYTVKYESGEETPASFPTAESLAFHCDTNTSKDGYYYRTLGMVRAVETADYEVYMITVTPTSDNAGMLLANTAAGNTSYSYSGTEVVAWAATQTDLDNSGLGTYTSISGAFTYSIGGEPIVSGLEIYRQQGMKVTYYVRAKVTEDSLAVHYIDQTVEVETEFYSYNIAVKSGTLFNEGFALNDGSLVNNTVTNLQGNTQTVSANLSTMPAIGAQYRYSTYTCVKVERSEDGKDVYLYYTFNNAHSFVIDFGLPLVITHDDLNLSDFSFSSATYTQGTYGTVDGDSENHTLTYSPTKALQGIDSLQLTLTGANSETGENESATHQIYIYPATTVYYEEGFVTYSDGWTGGSKGTDTQATQVAGASTDEYGYDAKYAGESNGPSNGTQATSSAKGNTATFDFRGTGVDIYANSTTSTGSLMIQVKNTTDGSTVKLLQVNTALKNGDTTATEEQAVQNGYNVPVASITGLTRDYYTMTITHIDTATVNLDGFRVYDTLNPDGNSHKAGGVYANDAEDHPTFIELRDQVLAGLSVTSDGSGQVNAALPEEATTVALVASSAKYTQDNVNDLLNNGPKNEIYLQPQQALVLKITTAREVQIGLKALNAATTYTINNESKSISTSTDMFYTVLNKGTSGEQTITITNNGTGILAVTKLKVCDDPNATLGTLTVDDLTDALVALGIIEAEPEEPTDPAAPVDPIVPVDPEEPGESIEEPVEPTKPVKPTQPTQPGKGDDNSGKEEKPGKGDAPSFTPIQNSLLNKLLSIIKLIFGK